MRRLFLLLIWVFSISGSVSGNVIITGQIKNFSRSKINLHIQNSSDLTFEKYQEKIPIDITKDGFFRKELTGINVPLLNNFLDLGNRKIYFGYFPSDSLFISMDYKDIDNTLMFKGTNADKNYFINNYLNLVAKEIGNKKVQKMKFADYKTFKEAGLKNYLTLLKGYKEKYSLDTAYYYLQQQEIIFNFYNELGTFDKRRTDEPHLECYDTTNLLNNRYMMNNVTYYSVLTGYMRYKYQVENNNQKVATEFQPYYLAYKYLSGDVLENYLGYFIMFHLNFNFSEQTIDNIKTMYFDYRRNHRSTDIYKTVTRKAIEIMLIRKNE